ncbi:hypothetical protein AJ79_04424 [Helicocarpus griseus UAMH5409]|uniref:Protein kinase domain-containing protein n=1 Tax=Helicocarpus griseus UAMH5409 TaxID=1447875 RepID=A0A2B7XKH0_9EURO|nr:hypothetical protein AJ79_04424 [Helicocarpus griseus UAMH5409]
MAKIVAFLGPPPAEFVGRSGFSKNCFDETGKWAPNEPVGIPGGCTLEDAEVYLTEKERELFLQFIRSMLKWLPEERKTAAESLQDPWLSN